jgi:electron transport complex protein RnfC
MGLLTRLRTFEGGLFFPPVRADTAAEPVEILAAPPILRVPLGQSDGPVSRPVVTPGQRVAEDDPLAEAVDTAGAVHSPVAGTVRGTMDVPTPYRTTVAAVEIEVAQRTYTESAVYSGLLDPGDWPDREGLEATMNRFGVDGPDIISLNAMDHVDRIIVSGLDCEPGFSANLRTVADHPEAVIETAARLHDILGAWRTHLVVDDTRRTLVAALLLKTRRTPVRICPLPNKYPQDQPRLLVRSVAGTTLSHSQSLEDAGMWCTDACTLMDIHRAVISARPHTWQTVTVSGDAVARPGNYRFPLGATLREVVRQVGLERSPRRLLVGSALRGVACASPDLVLTKRTRAIAVLRDNLRVRHEATACIRCGACQDVCPMGLDPRALLEAAERKRFSVAARLLPQACVSCGLCDFVCPSSLPLMRGVEQCREHVSRG